VKHGWWLCAEGHVFHSVEAGKAECPVCGTSVMIPMNTIEKFVSRLLKLDFGNFPREFRERGN